jgi:hypothetical protein
MTLFVVGPLSMSTIGMEEVAIANKDRDTKCDSAFYL